MTRARFGLVAIIAALAASGVIAGSAVAAPALVTANFCSENTNLLQTRRHWLNGDSIAFFP